MAQNQLFKVRLAETDEASHRKQLANWINSFVTKVNDGTHDVVIQSPDGSKFKLAVDNSGNLSTSEV